MNRTTLFEQIRGYVDQLEQASKMTNENLPSYLQEPKREETPQDNYDNVLEEEFVKDKIGQEFAKQQFEMAQKYLISTFMATPEGRKLAEERAKAFQKFRDDKLKTFFDSVKKQKKPEVSEEEK